MIWIRCFRRTDWLCILKNAMRVAHLVRKKHACILLQVLQIAFLRDIAQKLEISS